MLLNFLEYIRDYLDFEVVAFGAFLTVSLLVTLYAIALVNKKLRVVHEEIRQISEDNRILNETIMLLQDSKFSAAENIPDSDPE